MRSEQDVFSIDIESSQEVDSSNGESGFERQFLTDDDIGAETAVFPVRPGAPRRDERKSPRYAVPEARQACELKVGGNRLPALLVDESRGGFAVLIDCLDGLKPGKRIKLRTDIGWCQVRIVYITKTVRPAHSDSSRDCWFRLGLKKARSFLLF